MTIQAEAEKVANRVEGLEFRQITWLSEQVEKLNGRAKRLKLSPLVLDVTPEPFDSDDEDASPTFTAVLSGEIPRLNGYTFLARVERLNGVSIIKEVPGQECPTKYQQADVRICEHCNTKRDRNKGYILRKDETGETFQVGSSCLRSFIGTLEAAQLLSWAEDWGFMGREYGDPNNPNPKRCNALYEVAYMAGVFINLFGYTSKGAATENRPSTAACVTKYLGFKGSNPKDCWAHQMIKQAKVDGRFNHEEAGRLASEGIKYFREMSEAEASQNNFKWTLRAICRGVWVRAKDEGFACYIPEQVRKMEEEARKQAAPPVTPENQGGFVGQVGEKVSLRLNFLRLATYANAWGNSFIHQFEDGQGNVVSFSASKNHGLETGRTYQVTGKVKDHRTTKKGERYTALHRCKVTESP